MKILISGSSSGIGLAITKKLLADNHSVIGLARHRKTPVLEATQYHRYAIDFADIAQLESSLRAIQREHPDVDALICCVGYGKFAELEQFSVAQMQNIMNVNFLSQAVLIKTFLPQLKAKKSGKIIVLGSECALEGYKKGSLYCASKFALRGFTQSLRKECVVNHIAVTLINPGLVDTPFFDDLSFRPAKGEEFSLRPDNIADLVGFLLMQHPVGVYEEINLQPLKQAVQKHNPATVSGKLLTSPHVG